MSRASRYSAKVANTILTSLAEGRSLREICRTSDDLPTERAVRQWVLEDREGFAARYTLAREIGYHSMADEILDIVDDGRNDWVDRHKENGEIERVLDREHISRSKLRFEARQWLLSKALPKVYGDKLALSGDTENPVNVVIRKFTDA